MAKPDPLQAAAAHYTAEKWGESDWRQFGRETGTSDIMLGHSRLYRSLTFGDDDYPDAALEVLGRVLSEGVEHGAGEAERMELLADAMPDLPEWTAANAPQRTQRIFRQYLDARDPSEVPEAWTNSPVVPTTWTRRVEDPIDDFAPEDSHAYSSSSITSDAVVPEAAADARGAEIEPFPDTSDNQRPRKIFIVHGHDEAAMNSVRVYVHRETGIMPISLAEEAGRGQTIIEKFESYGEQASFVIVLLTPDDVGQTSADRDNGMRPNPRARQNVVLELGYFIGSIGRAAITVVNAGVERPSDLAGLSYVDYPGTNWKDDLRQELLALGLTA